MRIVEHRGLTWISTNGYQREKPGNVTLSFNERALDMFRARAPRWPVSSTGSKCRLAPVERAMDLS